MPPEKKILVSACLLGRECRYDGRSSVDSALARALPASEWVPVCPEELGGLGTPRKPAEIRGGAGAEVLEGGARVVDRGGRDVTRAFLDGARLALREGTRVGAKTAYLKSRSPSCGLGRISNQGTVRAGNGVFAELCRREGIQVIPCEGSSDPSRPEGSPG